MGQRRGCQYRETHQSTRITSKSPPGEILSRRRRQRKQHQIGQKLKRAHLERDQVQASILRVLTELRDNSCATVEIIVDLRSNNQQAKTDEDHLQKERAGLGTFTTEQIEELTSIKA